MTETREPAVPEKDPGYQRVRDFLLYGLSLPERTLRSASGVVGGVLRESASLLVPQAFQNSKTYNMMVRQMLDFLAVDIGGVQGKIDPAAPPQVEDFVARRTVGSFLDLASMATFHLSPMLLLAVVSDVAYGSKTYLTELAAELKSQGVIAQDSTIDHVDDLLAAVAATTKNTASAFETPPFSLGGLKQTIDQTRQAVQSLDPASVLPQAEVQRLWNEIREVATSQGVHPLAISGAMTLYSLEKIGTVGRGALSTVRALGVLMDRHVLEHYKTALGAIRSQGLYATLAQTSKPYINAVWMNFSVRKDTITEGLLTGRLFARGWVAVLRWWGRKRKVV
jgi:hypothetical protein